MSILSLSKNDMADLRTAKIIAKRLFVNFDVGNKGVIDQKDCLPMLISVYRSLNQQFSPSDTDVENYFKSLDNNQDGRITYEDIEKMCIKLLCPNGTASLTCLEYTTVDNSHLYRFQSEGYSPNRQLEIPIYTTIYQTLSENTFLNPYNTSLPPSYDSKTPKTTTITQKNDTKRSPTPPPTQSRLSPAIEKILIDARRIFRRYDKENKMHLKIDDIYNLVMDTYQQLSFTTTDVTKAEVTRWLKKGDLVKHGGISMQDYEIFFLESLQLSHQKIDLAELKEDQKILIQKKMQTQTQRKSVPNKQPVKRPSFDVIHGNDANFNQILHRAHKMFENYDKDGSGFLERTEILSLLKETYEKCGIKGEVNEEDVNVLIYSNDKIKNGQMSLQDYLDMIRSIYCQGKLKQV